MSHLNKPIEQETIRDLYETIEFRRLYEAIANLINFCWNPQGWIGTETIRRSGQFLKLMGELRDAITPFILKDDKTGIYE